MLSFNLASHSSSKGGSVSALCFPFAWVAFGFGLFFVTEGASEGSDDADFRVLGLRLLARIGFACIHCLISDSSEYIVFSPFVYVI
jgi:hypothetical protein